MTGDWLTTSIAQTSSIATCQEQGDFPGPDASMAAASSWTPAMTTT
jgi:hypothetical protein